MKLSLITLDLESLFSPRWITLYISVGEIETDWTVSSLLSIGWYQGKFSYEFFYYWFLYAKYEEWRD